MLWHLGQNRQAATQSKQLAAQTASGRLPNGHPPRPVTRQNLRDAAALVGQASMQRHFPRTSQRAAIKRPARGIRSKTAVKFGNRGALDAFGAPLMLNPKTERK